MEIIKLSIENNSTFKIRDHKEKILKNIPSYTLFSALVNNMALFLDKNQVDDYIKKFEDIKISSVFMGIDIDGKEILLVPKPKILILPSKKDSLLGNDYDPSYQKDIKKIEYLSLSLLNELSKTWNEEDKCFYFDLKEDGKQIGRNILVKKDDLPMGMQNENLEGIKLRITEVDKKTKVDRWTVYDSEKLHNDERIIYRYCKMGNMEIKPFLYFLIDGDLDENIRFAIDLLKTEGLGGKRSLGYGQIENVEYKNYKEQEKLLSEDGRFYMSLSSFIPKKNEVESLLSFDITKVNGYIFLNGGLGYRKKTMGIIREGAILDSKVEGRICDVTPERYDDLEHNFFLYGKSLNIGLGDIDG